MKTSRTFTDQMHELAQPLWLQSVNHPFIKQLISGELPMSTFRYYLLQDRYYLSEFGKLHDLIAEQMDDPVAIDFLRKGAEGLKNGEIAVRKGFFTQLNITKEEIALTPSHQPHTTMSTTCTLLFTAGHHNGQFPHCSPATGCITRLARRSFRKAPQFRFTNSGLKPMTVRATPTVSTK